ncbi:MAG TPA: hypothetical protein VF621_05080 [Pyrinomonadaceae bacterium]|jgi:hypothetical protein
MPQNIPDSVKSNYFSGQGDVIIAKRSSAGVPGSFWLIGNAPKFEVKPTMERREHRESRSGNRLVDKTQTTTKGGTLDITFEDIRKDNLALLLSGKKVTLPPGSFTAGSPDTFPAGLVVGSLVKLTRPNASSIVVKDSAGTPVTLTAGTHYRVLDAEHGLIEILSLGAFVQPFKAEYSYAQTDVITTFEANDDDEYWVYFAGVNTEGSPDQKIGMDIYRVVFNAAELIALINEEQGTFDISARILRDEVRASDANFGGFARWLYINANA